MPRWIEPKTAVAAEKIKAAKLESAIFNVCWRCESGGHNKQTLYRVGSENGQTIYACAAHRGLRGQLA